MIPPTTGPNTAQAEKTIELLNDKGNPSGSLKMLSNFEIQSPSGWKLRKMNP